MPRPSSQPSSDAAALLVRFARTRLLVVGDVMLDRFLWGRAERISPEAPVPVVKVERESLRLGGAANVAANLRSLGARVRLIGMAGEDRAAARLKHLLRETGIPPEDLIDQADQPTLEKTRIIAQQQQVVRFDREGEPAYGTRAAERGLARLEKALGWADAVIVSDYDKGMVTRRLMEVVQTARKRRGLFVAVDPKPSNFSHYRGVSIATPNLKEAGEIWGRPLKSPALLMRAGRDLLRRHRLETLLITRGEEGMSLFEPGGHLHIPTMAREVFDVTGAGDTVIAVLTLAVAAGATLRQAAFVANAAAGVVVGEVGTAVVRPDQLEAALRPPAAEGRGP